MIENIVKIQGGYRATIDGSEWTIPEDEGNRFYRLVKEAIDDGAVVSNEDVAPAPQATTMTFAQLLIGLVAENWISVTEAKAWRDREALPIPVRTVIDSLPAEQQFAAETRALTPSVVLRDDPMVNALAALVGKTQEELNNFFNVYSKI